MDANAAVSPHWSAFWDRPRECLNSIFHWNGNVIWHFRHCLHRESCQKDNLRYSHLRKCRPNETFPFQLERVRIESMGNWGTKYPSQVKSYFRGEKSILALVGWQMLPISCEASLLYHNRDYKNDKHNCLQSKTDRSTRRCYFSFAKAVVFTVWPKYSDITPGRLMNRLPQSTQCEHVNIPINKSCDTQHNNDGSTNISAYNDGSENCDLSVPRCHCCVIVFWHDSEKWPVSSIIMFKYCDGKVYSGVQWFPGSTFYN